MHFLDTSLGSRIVKPVILLLLIPLFYACSSEPAASKASGYNYAPPVPAPTPVDARAETYSVTLLDGGGAKLSDLVGHDKIVLINFWATWCGPCRREIPDLVALQRDLRSKGIEVIGLTVEDPVMDSQKVREFSQRFGINYRIGFSPKEMFMAINGADPRGVIPQTFIFDRKGRLVDSARGFRRDFRDWVLAVIEHADGKG